MEHIVLNQIKRKNDSSMKLTFGMYAGRDVRNVPWEYLWWLYVDKVEVPKAIEDYLESEKYRLIDYMVRRDYEVEDGPDEVDEF